MKKAACFVYITDYALFMNQLFRVGYNATYQHFPHSFQPYSPDIPRAYVNQCKYKPYKRRKAMVKPMYIPSHNLIQIPFTSLKRKITGTAVLNPDIL